MLIPIYQDRKRKFAADTCRPVVEAVAAGQLRQVALSRGQYPGRRLPPRVLPGVKTIGFWDATHRQDWGLDWHRNEGVELTLLESGELGFAVDNAEFQLKAGDLTFTRPWQRHRVGDPKVGAGRLHCLILDVGVRRPHQAWRWPSWIVLTPEDRRELTEVLRHNEQPVWQATSDMIHCFRRIATAVESDQNGSSVSHLAVRLNQLFLALLEMFRGQSVRLDQSLSSTRRTVELFWNDVRDNLETLGAEWTVRGMASRCGIGATNFISYTRQLTNRTPIQYLNHCRLRAAAQLLRERPELSVTDVALRCGFSSSQYFATLFREEFAAKPRDYRAASVGKRSATEAAAVSDKKS